MADKLALRNVERSMKQCNESDTLYMYYNDDRTGYLMILSSPDSCYGVMPFFVHFKLGEGQQAYPFFPPVAKYISVDSARVHPNLYADGKICLSILGTWQGPGWTAAFTLHTLAQNIEMIINEDYPLQCEPSFEDMKSEPVLNYNAFLRHLSVKQLAHKSYKVPIPNENARQYFTSCLKEYLQQEENWKKVVESFQHNLREPKGRAVRNTFYNHRLDSAATQSHLDTLIERLREIVGNPEAAASSSSTSSRSATATTHRSAAAPATDHIELDIADDSPPKNRQRKRKASGKTVSSSSSAAVEPDIDCTGSSSTGTAKRGKRARNIKSSPEVIEID
eukprot:gb/GECG01006951.1/.p1 GENE.gb/GECG01006951.1/~~gb/GECG01006951.1/.p1  ORF type:complete len:335 (+),score=38.86 gb/GECG01006951.1/:1-1005(+)